MDNYTIFLSSQYFNTIEDFINLELTTKRFQGNLSKFHYNPITLNDKTVHFFPNIQTYYVYNEEDELLTSNKINKYVLWYKMNYSQSLMEKLKGNECKNVYYSEEDKQKYKLLNQIFTKFGG